MNISVVVLTYNAESYISDLLDRLKKQTTRFQLVVIDSSSSDATTRILRENNVDFVSIPKDTFNHGGTRNLALNYATGDIAVYLTQDALPDNDAAIETLAREIEKNEKVAIAYGKQLPYPDATFLSSFARQANYPDVSIEKNKALIPVMGIKTCHCSNSFAAYRVSVLKELGMFPNHCIMCEDVYVGAKAILQGYSIYYSAEARVIHSHNYSIAEEFKRYFDIGVFYNGEKWILDNFSGAEKEGIRFLLRELRHIISKGKIWLIPEFFIRVVSKFLGYKLGKYEKKLSPGFKQKISMHRYFWKKPVQVGSA